MGGATQAMKRIPRIKFPQRHPKPPSSSSSSSSSSSGSASQDQVISTTGDAPPAFFSRAAPSNMSVGGKASLQPKRTPLSEEEIEAIMLGGCI